MAQLHPHAGPQGSASLSEVLAALDSPPDAGRDRIHQMLSKGQLAPTAHFGYDGTPLSLAVSRGRDDIVGLLLDAGADVNGRAGAFETSALFDAASLEEAEGTSTLALLLQRGATLPGSGALQAAAARLKPATVRFLLARGAPVDEAIDEDDVVFDMHRRGEPDAFPSHETALHAAARALLVHPDEYTRLKDGAAHVDTLRALLEAGADPARKDSTGKSALDIAEEAGLVNVAHLLKRWKAPMEGVDT